LDGLLAWIACIASAQPVDGSVKYLGSVTLVVERVELHDEALAEMVQQIGMRLLGAEIMVGLNKLNLPDVNFNKPKQLAMSALDGIHRRQLGYAIITASKRRLVAWETSIFYSPVALEMRERLANRRFDGLAVLFYLSYEHRALDGRDAEVRQQLRAGILN
jgi:hypothetical protein